MTVAIEAVSVRKSTTGVSFTIWNTWLHVSGKNDSIRSRLSFALTLAEEPLVYGIGRIMYR
jgi:hypothetical protein